MPATARLVTSRPRAVLLLFLAGTAALGSQAGRFKIDAGADTLLTKDNEHYIRTQVVDRRYAPQEFLLVAYKPRNRPLLSERTFRDLRALDREISRLERVESVRSILEVPLTPKGGGGAAGRSDLADWTVDSGRYRPEELAREFRGHPIYEDLLINKDQTATALQVLFREDAASEDLDGRIVDLQRKSLREELSREERRKLDELKREAEKHRDRLSRTRAAELEAIRAILAGHEDGADLYLGGVHALAHQLIEIINNDLLVFGGAIGAMIALVLYVLFRGLRWVVIAGACCASSVASTLGLFGLLGLKATVISSSFVALQLILTLAIVIHLIVQYREFSADRPDWNQAELVRRTLSRKAAPCFYAGFINVVGFASLLLSGLKPVIDFGWMMSIAMFFSIATSLILCPAMMALFGREEAAKTPALPGLVLHASARLALGHPAAIAFVSGLLLAACAFGVLRLEVENSFIDYFHARTVVHKELSFIDRELGGTTPLDLTYALPEAGRKKDLVLTARDVRTLQLIQHALEKREAVGKTLSIVNFTELAKAMNDGKPLTEYELTALYWTMDKELRSDLLGSFFSPADSELRLSVRIKDTTEGLDRTKLVDDIRADLARLGVPPERYRLTGLFILYQDLLSRLYRSQILTLGASFGVLALAIFAIFRSVKLALICVAPTILSTVIVLGLMGWLGIPLDFMTIMIAAITLGITVDDTIHYIDRYLEELRRGAEGAVERTQTSVGFALLYTSLIVILGFSLLGFSDFVPSVLFGLLTSLAMFLAVLFDFTLLPALLGRFVRARP